MTDSKYWQAINLALHDALEEDSTVCVLGEDVGAAGGPFAATMRLQERFGSNRVRDTPISEACIVGAATGAAMTGLKPVVEVMFMDFMCLAMDQIVNQAAKFAYMSGGTFSVPLTIRTVVGAGRQTGPQHSQSFESWLAAVPGLKVVWSSTPADAYTLLREAIADPDPVIVIESLRLWNQRGPIHRATPSTGIRASTVRRLDGHDITVAAWGSCVDRVLDAAGRCAPHTSVEVLDLRSLSPIDMDVIVEASRRTGRLLIVQDAPGPCSIASEIAGVVGAENFGRLRAPVVRLSPPFAPAPFAPAMEEAFFPSITRIVDSINQLVRYRQ